MPGRIVILSDTHLGRTRGAAISAQALRPLWHGAARLILNGDIAELHHPLHADRAEQEVLDLFEGCERDGVTLTLIAGNHDPFISDLKHVHIGGDTIFVTHGDVLHPAISPWSPAAPRVREATEKALTRIAPEDRDHLEARLAVSRYASTHECRELERMAESSMWSQALLRPWSVLQVLAYWWRIPRIAAHFTKNHCPDARFIIFGHTHRPGIWHIDDLVVINTGSFGFPGRPRAIVIEGSELAVWPILLRGRKYQFSDRPIRRYELPRRISAPSALKTRPVIFRPKTPAM